MSRLHWLHTCNDDSAVSIPIIVSRWIVVITVQSKEFLGTLLRGWSFLYLLVLKFRFHEVQGNWRNDS